MKRSVGVTVIAVLSLIASILTLLMGVLVAVVIAFVPAPHSNELPPAAFKIMVVVGALVYILPAIWGIITSVGLFRLSNWARISIIVFSVLLIVTFVFSGFSMLLLPAMPSNSGVNPGTMHAMQAVGGVFSLTLVGIGVWWLVFFTRASVKQQFVIPSRGVLESTAEISASGPQISPVPVVNRGPERPISFTVIAWFLLIGCMFMPLNFLLHFPAILMTKLVTGWPAVTYYIVLTAVSLYIGIGLLRFKPYARETAIGYFSFLLINAGFFYLAPGGHARVKALLAAQSGIFPWMRFWQPQPEVQFDLTSATLFGGAAGLIFMALPLYFLITRKKAFESVARSR